MLQTTKIFMTVESTTQIFKGLLPRSWRSAVWYITGVMVH